ncbi:DUF4349 domain-containing protein [Staphylospora marina]|uniref:DUF4349 domain-containing protein n=1 Tax=Staphylospora marina TaxID=2490858 RepID=UPI000F5BB63C|nr:DUF4349 domain-containing protein [Staphylospora marina]
MQKRSMLFLMISLISLSLWGCGPGPTATDNATTMVEERAVRSGEAPSVPSKLSGPATDGGTGQALDKASEVRKQMIYTANLRLTVKNYKQVLTEMEQIATDHGAYLVGSSESRTSDRIELRRTYRVPAADFSRTVSELGKLSDAAPPQTQIQGTDVSEEMVDLESRLKAKQAAESRLLSMMQKANDPKSLLEISRELDRIQSEIEQLKGRIRYLSHHVSYSTLNVTIVQPVVSPISEDRSLPSQMADAFKNGAAQIGTFLEQLLIVLAGITPVLLVAGIPVVIFLLIRKRRKKQDPPTT